MSNQLTAIDFFCGAGGFSEGFRQAGISIVKGYDNWKPAVNTFRYNFNCQSELKDILDFKDSIDEINRIPDTDIILGSPPCVSFSSSNLSGKADKKSGILLTKIFLRIVAVKKFQKNSRLKGWFMENVKNSKNYLPDYFTFNDLGLSDWAKENKYSPRKKAIILKGNQPLINSADYGSYQARKRIISGEIIKYNKLIIPKPEFNHSGEEGKQMWKKVGDLLDRLPTPNQGLSNKIILDPNYPVLSIPSSKITDHFYDTGLYECEWRQSKFLKVNHPYMGKMSFPENLEKPSRTITATKIGTSREAIVYKSEYNRKKDGCYRTPTVREAASIMGFPLNYQFIGSIGNKWRLVGNAVCPSVSKAFANQLLGCYNYSPSRLKFDQKDQFPDDFINLNDYSQKKFDKIPRRKKNSRFRRHPFKDGNITVTLSNYNILTSEMTGEWYTSVQYGNGEGFPCMNYEDFFYEKIEGQILQLKDGVVFLELFERDILILIASGKELQDLYESQISNNNYLEPTLLIEKVADLINSLDVNKKDFDQREIEIFEGKEIVPFKQVLALYAINKISSKINSFKYAGEVSG